LVNAYIITIAYVWNRYDIIEYFSNCGIPLKKIELEEITRINDQLINSCAKNDNGEPITWNLDDKKTQDLVRNNWIIDFLNGYQPRLTRMEKLKDTYNLAQAAIFGDIIFIKQYTLKHKLLGFSGIDQKIIYTLALNGHIHVLTYLIETASFESQDGISGLEIAARRGRKEIVMIFIDYEVPCKKNVMINAIIRGRIEIVKYLLEKMEIIDEEYEEYIKTAKESNYTDIIEILKTKKYLSLDIKQIINQDIE
jgi:hypothetical protein